MMRRIGLVILAAVLALNTRPAVAQSKDMPMSMPTSPPATGQTNEPPMSMPMNDMPAHFAPTREAYSSDHQFLVKLLEVPKPIPYQNYFTLRFAVYDGRNPSRQLGDATLSLAAGMRHGMKEGFAHGMDSSPKITVKDGVFTVSGMYFHMMGAWTLQLTVREGQNQGTVLFELPCCGA